MSSSSLSENVSIDNDPDTPPSPLTPPPSPLSINENPIARVNSETTVNEESTTEPQDAAENENETDTQNAQNVRESFNHPYFFLPNLLIHLIYVICLIFLFLNFWFTSLIFTDYRSID